VIEGVYMGWFTLEFVVRFVSSPSKVTPSLEIMVDGQKHRRMFRSSLFPK